MTRRMSERLRIAVLCVAIVLALITLACVVRADLDSGASWITWAS